MKLKVGDTVKPISEAYKSWRVGVVGNIDLQKTYPIYVEFGGETGAFKESELELVNRPSGKADSKQVGGSHYKGFKIQPSKFIRENNLGWYEGNAIKRICRHGLKNGREDIEKAIHELEFILEEYDEKGS